MNRSGPICTFAYGVSFAGLGAAVLLRWLLDPVLGDTLPLITSIAAIGVAVWLGGYRPAVLVAVLGYLACAYLFIPPRGQFGLSEPRNIVGLLLYLTTASVIIGFGEALRRAQQHFRLGDERTRQQAELMGITLANLGDAVIATDPEGRVTNMNAVAQALTGWTNDEAAVAPLTQVFRIINESSRQQVENPALRALQDGSLVGLADHTILIAKDGGERPIDAIASPLRSERGEVVGCVLVFRDVSAQHRAEAQRREAQQQVVSTLESVTDGFMRYDRDWRIVYVNAEAERINRLTRSETLGRKLWEVFPALVGTSFESEFRRAVAEQTTVEFEHHYEPFGRWYSLKGYPTADGGLTTFIRDITTQKESENALRASEERSEFVRRSSGVGFWYCDLPFDKLQWDELVKAHFHLPEDASVTIQTFYDRIHPDDRQPTRQAIERSIADRTPYNTVYRTVNPSTGAVTWVQAIGRTFYAADGTPNRFDGVTLDVSDRKRAEQEIIRLAAESEKQRRLYETVLTNTPDFVYVFSLDHKVLYANDALIKMWGRGYEGAIGKTFLEIGYEPWHAEMHDREIDQVRATRQPIRGEVPFTGTNGRREYDYIFVPVIGADGEVEAVAGTTRDVTERKETETQLREGQEQLDFALSAADLGYWSLNLTDHTARRTLRHDQIFGYNALLPEWTYEMFLKHVVPADQAEVDAAFQKSVATSAPWAVECRIRGADGAIRHIWKKGLVRRDAEGKAERMLAIVGDITDRRKAEERQTYLVKLADTLRPLADPADVQSEASRVLGEWLGADRVVYFEVRGDEYVIERDYAAGKWSLSGRYPVDSFGQALLAAFLEGRTVIEADATTSPDRPPGERAAFAAIQVRGHVDVPLVKDGRFVAGLTVHVSDRRDWTPQEVALIEETAERTWGAVERVRAEREVVRLAAEAERERTLFDTALSNTTDFNFIFGLDGRFVYANRSLLALWGRTAEEAIGGSMAELGYPPDVEAQLLSDIQRVAETGLEVRDETPFTSRTGETGHYEYVLAPVFDAGGAVVQVVGSARDIRDRKRTEADLRRLAAELSEAARRKDEFLAILAHELRNPLAPIQNALQIMHLAGVNGTIEEARAMMERQLMQLIRLVDDLLDVSRVTSGKLTLHRERVELKAVIEAAVETSRPAIEQAGHELAVVVPDAPILLDGDPTRLSQVVSNLLNNSAKYTRRGGHIRLTARRDEDVAVVVVADDGIGIPPNMVGKVFEMFTQVDRALEKTTGGLGIGLSLVKGLVEMHGGTIEARSEGEGRGCEFIARLPVAVSVPRKVEPSVVAETVGSIHRRRILVADDNVDSARSLGRLLELSGNDVSTANDGLQAVDLAEAFQPEVILLDIAMPNLNGYEVCRRIREQPWGKHATLVAMTGWGQEEDKRRSHEAGFDLHLVKPVDFEAIKKLLSGLKTEMA